MGEKDGPVGQTASDGSTDLDSRWIERFNANVMERIRRNLSGETAGETTHRVFPDPASKVGVILRDVVEKDGCECIFGPASFEECHAYVRGRIARNPIWGPQGSDSP